MEYYKKLKYLFSNRINLNVEGQETISFGNKGASTIEIKNLSDFLIDFIPNDYIEFLTNWNGCTLFDLKQQAGFVFFGTNEIEREILVYQQLTTRHVFGNGE